MSPRARWLIVGSAAPVASFTTFELPYHVAPLRVTASESYRNAVALLFVAFGLGFQWTHAQYLAVIVQHTRAERARRNALGDVRSRDEAALRPYASVGLPLLYLLRLNGAMRAQRRLRLAGRDARDFYWGAGNVNTAEGLARKLRDLRRMPAVIMPARMPEYLELRQRSKDAWALGLLSSLFLRPVHLRPVREEIDVDVEVMRTVVAEYERGEALSFGEVWRRRPTDPGLPVRGSARGLTSPSASLPFR